MFDANLISYRGNEILKCFKHLRWRISFYLLYVTQIGSAIVRMCALNLTLKYSF